MKTQTMFSRGWSEVTSGERNAIVFERLNQSYGAYEIRKNYDRTLLKAFSATTLLILLLSAYLLISAFLKNAEVIIPPSTNATLIVLPPKANDPEIPKLPEQPRMHSSLMASLVPVVTTDRTHDDVIIPKNTNSNLPPTGNSKDSTGEGPEIIPGKKGVTFVEDDTTTYPLTSIEEMPRFPGGDNGLFSFLKKNVAYPQEIREINGKGVVGISFVIGKDGSVTDINLYRGTIYSQLNNEAMRVITKMPKWEPGRQNGKPVKVRMILPIRFELKE